MDAADTLTSPLRGQIGPYELLREIGRGAVGVVYEGRRDDGTPAAVKVVTPPALLRAEERESLRSRFFREARAMAAVQHPNVTRIYDVGEEEGLLYMAMELLQGDNLRQILTRTGPFPTDETIVIGLQLCDALDAVHHAGIVHRDIKPENVMVLPDGCVKLTDFGVAWMENEATLTRTGGVLGSPAYMAPEQILGRSTDKRSDLFSAAATLYQIATGRLPFQGATLMEMAHNVAYSDPKPLPADVPHALGRTILRGLQKSPGARYTTATELAQALSAAMPAPNRAPALPSALGTVGAADPALAGTVVDVRSRCARHPGRGSVGQCQACHRPLCRHCARSDSEPYFCLIHTPVTLFGVSTVRLEVALMVLVLVLLLLSLTPFGILALRQ